MPLNPLTNPSFLNETPQQVEVNELINGLSGLIAAIPDRANMISLISLINKVIIKLKLPLWMQGTETALLIWQIIMGFLKVNVWTWANESFSEQDPHKNIKVGALFATFIGLIPSLFSYIHLLLTATKTNHATFLKHVGIQFVTLLSLPLAFDSAASLVQTQKDFSPAAQQAIMAAAYLVFVEGTVAQTTTVIADATFLVALKAYRNVLKPLADRIRAASCFRGQTLEEGDPLLRSDSAYPESIKFGPRDSVDSKKPTTIGKTAKKILKVLRSYDSLPYLFLFCLVLLFMINMFYEAFTKVLSNTFHLTNEYSVGNFLAMIALLFSLLVNRFEKKVLKLSKGH